MLKKIFFSIFFISIINTTYASFPITEKYHDNLIIYEEPSSKQSSLYGNLSLIFSILPLLVLMDIGFPPFFIFFCVPAIILGMISLKTKGKTQGMLGMIIGLIEMFWIVTVLALWGTTLGLI